MTCKFYGFEFKSFTQISEFKSSFLKCQIIEVERLDTMVFFYAKFWCWQLSLWEIRLNLQNTKICEKLIICVETIKIQKYYSVNFLSW